MAKSKAECGSDFTVDLYACKTVCLIWRRLLKAQIENDINVTIEEFQTNTQGIDIFEELIDK